MKMGKNNFQIGVNVPYSCIDKKTANFLVADILQGNGNNYSNYEIEEIIKAFCKSRINEYYSNYKIIIMDSDSLSELTKLENVNGLIKENYIYLKRENVLSLKEGKIDIIDCDYDNDIYEERIKGYETCPERGARCTICFNLRLEKTAQIAAQERYDYFCSTLTVSPYKNANLINEIGKNLSQKYKVKWLYSDFKKNEGYKHSIELSKKYNLYRQDYCGCVYSKRKNIID